MKKFTLFIMCIVIICACGKTSRVLGQESTWGEIVKFKLNEDRTKSSDSGLRLVNYSDRGPVNTQQEMENVLAEMFADDAPIAQGSPENVFFYTVKDFKVPYDENKPLLNDHLTLGMHVVDLFWEYHGKNYHNIGLFSDEFIFDLVGTLVGSNDIHDSKQPAKDSFHK